MDSVNKTLYIPLYGKALVSKKGVILKDEKAEQIWDSVQFPLKGKSKSKWLAYFMGMRAKVFDEWAKDNLQKFADSIVLHLGCGLDGRVERIGEFDNVWFDVDFPSVIDERLKYYNQSEKYKMLGIDIKDCSFIQSLPKTKSVIVILEGVSMYVENEQLAKTLSKITQHYDNVCVLVDCYTPFAAKMSKIKNPIKEVGVNKVYGVSSHKVFENQTGLCFVKEHIITPNNLIDQLSGFEKFIFKHVYAGKTSKKLYKRMNTPVN